MLDQKRKYASALPGKLDALLSALNASKHDPQNNEKLERVLTLGHKLRGSAGTYGFMAISNAAAAIEDRLLGCKRSDSLPPWQNLIEYWQDFIEKTQPNPAGDRSKPRSWRPSKKIEQPHRGHVLVLDDDEDFLQIIDAMLQAHGYRTTLTTQPSHVRQLLIEEAPDLLLLDIEMPEQNGIDVCVSLRADPRWKNIPILFLTAHGDVENRIAAFEAKANDFINKPVVEEELLARIGLRLERAQLLQEREAMLGRLERSHASLLSVLNQLNIGSAVTDEEGRILFISDACRHFLGLSPDEALGKRWHELSVLNQTDANQLSEMLHHAHRQKERTRLKVDVGRNRSYWLEVDVRINPTQDQGYIFYFYDITEVHDLREKLVANRHGRLVGNSKPMLELLRKAGEIARGTWTVMIEGETGSGKELVARTIHDLSPRNDKPFIAVNCAALTESIITSQLFGHRRGAFTGAFSDQQGVFEAADGGTLFLDEIGDIPMNVQTALLRVLEERAVTRVGETRSRKVDVRVLVATHKNLSQEVSEGRFREDLFYRIQVARIRVPPLRERREDIPLLAAACLDDCRLQAGKEIEGISRDAMQRLMAYDWPGNVRELKNAVQYAVIACSKPIIHLDDLPPEFWNPSADETKAEFKVEGKDEPSRILAALDAAKGNRTRAAQLLGIGRATLYRRIRELGMRLED